MYKLVSFLFFLLAFQKASLAQDTLPNISVTQRSNKVVIAWTNTFTTATTINIQRSGDSLKNFTTIGSVLNVKARSNGFVDAKEFKVSQYYRVFVSFEGGSYIFTKSHKPGLDTAKAITEVPEAPEVPQVPVKTWFVPSKRVYTGKDNNVIIDLPDADTKKYSIKFYEESGSLIFELKKVTESWLTLDKVNFSHAGLFNFEIYSDDVLVEKHKLYIPKDGKPFPVLDESGHEFK
ncbi:MAG: hypothetical protein ABI416_00290 [Ginsengibacter sp.]